MTDRDNERDNEIVEYRGTGFYIGLAAILLFAVALFILAVQNTQDISMSFLWWDFRVPLFSVAIGAALAAVLMDELIGLVWRRRRRSRLAERAELHTLRSERERRKAERAAAERESAALEIPDADNDGNGSDSYQ